MQRLSTILLAVLAVLVFGAAIYVVTDNTPTPVGGSPTDVSTTASTSSAGAASPSTPSTTSSARPTSSAAAKPVVAFLGDDWTAGSAATAKAMRFSTLVSARLGVTERNLGRNGSGYASGQTYDSRIADVVKTSPAVVVVSGGRNDVLGSAAPSAATVATVFRDLHTALPAAKIVALTPMWGDSQPPQALLDLAARVKSGVVAAGGTYLDVGDPLTGHAEYMADTSNPNDAGYAMIGAVVAPALKPLV